MTQKVIDNVSVLTTPKLMMQAIDDNFDELYASSAAMTGDVSTHYHTSDRNRANHSGTQLASTISDLNTAISGNSAVVANTAKVSNVTTNLSVTTSATTLTVVSSDGTDAVIPLATSTLSGLLAPAEKTAIATNSAKVSNVTTDLSYSQTSTTLTVLSSDGTDAVLPTATTSLAGVMSGAMVTKLNTASAAYESRWI